MAKTYIFDLDETVVNPVATKAQLLPDGSLDLELYRKTYTRKNVMRDRLLPLARVMRQAYNAGNMVIVLTARNDAAGFAKHFLAFHGLKCDLFLSREYADAEHSALNDGDYKVRFLDMTMPDSVLQNCIMFDDSPSVKKAMRKRGIPVMCAHKANKRLAK